MNRRNSSRNRGGVLQGSKEFLKESKELLEDSKESLEESNEYLEGPKGSQGIDGIP